MSGLGYTMRERRTRVEGEVEYESGNAHPGKACWQDVSRTGAQLRLGRYLVPGRVLRLRFDSPLDHGSRAEVTARVAWCRQVQGTLDFVAGLVVTRERPEAALAFSALRDQVFMVNGKSVDRVELPKWAALQAVGESERCVTGRMALQHAV